MSDFILRRLERGIMWLTISRPRKRNALDASMYLALARGLEEAEQDANVRVAVLTGSDDVFSSGKDLSEIRPAVKTRDAPVTRFLNALISFSKPVIAGVSGPAVGIGTTMLLHCDMIIASRTAIFRLPFVDLGLVPEAASSILLPRLIGYQRAAELFFTGRVIDAFEAERLGLVNRIVPVSALGSVTKATAEQLAGQPVAALRATKSLLRPSKGILRSRMTEEMAKFDLHMASAESEEAIAAFLNRRQEPVGVDSP